MSFIYKTVASVRVNVIIAICTQEKTINVTDSVYDKNKCVIILPFSF